MEDIATSTMYPRYVPPSVGPCDVSNLFSPSFIPTVTMLFILASFLPTLSTYDPIACLAAFALPSSPPSPCLCTDFCFYFLRAIRAGFYLIAPFNRFHLFPAILFLGFISTPTFPAFYLPLFLSAQCRLLFVTFFLFSFFSSPFELPTRLP